MFHVELRQFPHVARAFNLSRDELDGRILRPLAAGRQVQLNDRQWSPRKVKLAVYEGRGLQVEEIGMGRGWGNATKTGENVTERLLAEARQAVESPAALERLKEEVAARAAGPPIGYEELLALATEVASDVDANERVELAVRAVWELLRDGRVRLIGMSPQAGEGDKPAPAGE